MKESFSSLSEAINELQKEGFTEDFNLVEDGIESKALKNKWKAGQCEVLKYYRFEGPSDPGDNTILYLIETDDGKKGLLVDVYGADSGSVSPEMIKKLQLHHNE